MWKKFWGRWRKKKAGEREGPKAVGKRRWKNNAGGQRVWVDLFLIFK